MAEQANKPAPSAPTELIEESVETVSVRRAPKMIVFLVLGAAVGIAVAVILTYGFGVFDESGSEQSAYSAVSYTSGQIFGFLALICGVVGVAVGGVVALILERTVGRRTRQVQVDRERVTTVD
ncbi:potassium transporter Trk [Microbacterium protaetiae]|uniref:Potassium transporter Trk n=1 Tax=Microbacterium protaetiae TaxID=2509458 RepID=A0A4P6EPG4_9MICO|nr:potassium transporter Trk [Microbacterium protaetiae]QAY59858.1 potassium transporter Trk [Microbacterium protaetiae]